MASSSYYYSLMCSYSKSKRKLEDKKLEYENYIKKLEKVKNEIPTVIDCLSNSESTFRNGGYNDGDTPDRGEINNNISKLENASSIIDSVIAKTNAKITEFEQDIDKYTDLYNEAHSNYENAKRIESAKK